MKGCSFPRSSFPYCCQKHQLILQNETFTPKTKTIFFVCLFPPSYLPSFLSPSFFCCCCCCCCRGWMRRDGVSFADNWLTLLHQHRVISDVILALLSFFFLLNILCMKQIELLYKRTIKTQAKLHTGHSSRYHVRIRHTSRGCNIDFAQRKKTLYSI